MNNMPIPGSATSTHPTIVESVSVTEMSDSMKPLNEDTNNNVVQQQANQVRLLIKVRFFGIILTL